MAANTSPGLWALNWKEWADLALRLQPRLAGVFFEGASVPPRPDSPGGFIKGEWLLHFARPALGAASKGAAGGSGAPSTSYKDTDRITLWLSLRPQRVALRELPTPPKGVARAPLPPWLQKTIAEVGGKRVVTLEAFNEERILRLAWADHSLILTFIPARPEARLESPDWKPASRGETHEAPTRARPEPEAWTRALWEDVNREGLELRIARLERECKERLRKLGKSSRETEAHAPDPLQIANWILWGDLLLTHAHAKPQPVGGAYVLQDLESGEDVRIPLPKDQPKISPRDLAQRYYDQAKKKRRGTSENSERTRDALEKIERLKVILEKLGLSAQSPNREELALWEAELGLTPKTEGVSSRSKTGGEIPGKTFVSKDGSAILVGRNKKENLALTLKYARGNDVWLHLRGRPSSHAIVPVPSGKSASLETLLDAAQLIIHYGGGADWGTTEVDYTFRKYVKRIPKSDEVSYTQSKTLLVQPDRERLARLLGQGGG